MERRDDEALDFFNSARRAVGGLLIAAGLVYFIFFIPKLDAGGPAIAFRFLLGLGVMVIGAGCIWREMTSFVTSPIHQFLEGIYMPGERAKKPPVNYTLADSYFRQLRFSEALSEYLRILYYHPHEYAAYQSALLILTEKDPDPKAAANLFSKAMKKLKNPAELNAVAQWKSSGQVPLRKSLQPDVNPFGFQSRR